jgi:hypothetical protein
MALIRSSSQAVNASTQTITVTTPSGATTGDRLYFFVVVDNTTPDIADDSGTLTALQLLEGSFAYRIFRIALSGAPAANYSFTTTAVAGEMSAIAICINPNGDAFDAETVGTAGANSDPYSEFTVTGAAALVGPEVMVWLLKWGSARAVPTGVTCNEIVGPGSCGSCTLYCLPAYS